MKPTGKITKAQYEAMSHAERVSYQKKRLKRKKRQRDRLIFGIVLVFVCAVGVALSFTVFFKVATVEATGGERYSTEQIAAESGIELQSNMLMLNTEKIARQVEERLPYVGKAVVRRSLPDKIVIEVTETTAALAVAEAGMYTLLDENCKVLEKGVAACPEGAALLLGVDTSTILPGFYIADEEEPTTAEAETTTEAETLTGEEETTQRQKEEPTQQSRATVVKTLLSVTAAVREAEFANITAYDVTSLNDIKLVYQDRLTILLGTSSNLTQKLRLADKAIEEENALRPFRTGLVDVSQGKKASVRNEEHTTREDETEPVSGSEITTKAD